MSSLLLAFLLFADLDHSLWDTLLKRYVTEDSRVDYHRWRQNDTEALEQYIQEVASPWPAGMTSQQEKAALINAYNAIVIRWVIANYPIVSIWKTYKPFSKSRHAVNAKKVSLDELESRLRKLGDPRIHAALVCAARSCPPLRREAYTAAHLDQQLEDNTRAWLADPELNDFDAEKGKANLSAIFKWYRSDFPSIEDFVIRHAPRFKAGFSIDHKTYRWGLNDTELGDGYSQFNFLWDYARHR